MAEGLTEQPLSSSKKRLDVASAVAAAVAPADPLFGKRIEFHLERKPYSLTSSSGFQDFHLETLNPSTSQPQRALAAGSGARASGVAAQSGKKMDGGFDPMLSFRITFRRIGAGLQNLGNTCYLNSVLQCLTYTEPLAAYCQSGEHKSSCRTAGFCAMCALQNHVMNALQSTGRILSPSHLVKNLRCISRNFRNSRQEDAHEYMVNLLESMHKCSLPSGVSTESPSAYEKSFVYRIFGGRLRSQVKCTQCHYSSNKFDPFLDLSLEIFKADSLKKALAHFTAMEQLDGGERQYQCHRCKEKVRAYKQLTVHKAPYVLTIHLKRFGPDIPGQKIDKKVDFEPTLDLKPFVSDHQEADLKYTLYGVLVHAGWSTHSGHYYCFVRTSSGMWHSLDDNQVRPVSEKTVLAQKAYMLFYVRDISSVAKRSVDVGRDNVMANAPGSKVIPHPVSQLNRGIQNTERKLNILECSSAKSKVDMTSQGQPVSVVRNLSGQPLLIDAKNGNSIKKESPPLQNNGHTSLRQTTFSQNVALLSDGLQNSTLSKGSMILENPLGKASPAITSSHNQKAVQDLAHPCHLKDNDVSIPSHGNDSSLMHENGQVFDEKSGLYNRCNGKGEPSILAAQPINFRLSNLASDKHAENFPKQKGLHNEGTTNGVSQNNQIPCVGDIVCASTNKEPKTFCSQLSCSKGLNGKEHLSIKPAEHQNTFRASDRCMNNLQCQKGRENPLKIEQSGSSTSAKMLSDANGCVQQEAVAVVEIENKVSKCPTELKRKMGKSLLKGQYFGRKQLLSSIFLHKKKKDKRNKKHCLNPKKVIKDTVLKDLCTDEQLVSTSESIKAVDIAPGRSSKKRSRSSSNKKNNVVVVKDVKYCNGDFVHNRNLDSSGKNDVMLTTSEQHMSPLTSRGNQCNGQEADTHSKGPFQKDITSLLMSLKETNVPRWDDVELPPSQSHDLNDVQNTKIGYVLDEWDEEYDRGRRKKVKKYSHSFGGPNPFQEAANMKTQESMKVNKIRSGNQPLRI